MFNHRLVFLPLLLSENNISQFFFCYFIRFQMFYKEKYQNFKKKSFFFKFILTFYNNKKQTFYTCIVILKI